MRHAGIHQSGANEAPRALARALGDLRRELSALGLGPLFYWVTLVQSRRELSPGGMAWYTWGSHALKVPRWTRRARRCTARASGLRRISLRAVLRHEFGHALAEFLDLDHRPDFRDLFGHGEFVTEYARSDADEDFAETFMRYLTWGGQLRRRAGPSLSAKWRYVRWSIAAASGRRPRLTVACPRCGRGHSCQPGEHRCLRCTVRFRVAA